MDDCTTGLIVLIQENGEKAVIEALRCYCQTRADGWLSIGGGTPGVRSAAWDKLAYRLQGALDGMKRGQFGRVG